MLKITIQYDTVPILLDLIRGLEGIEISHVNVNRTLKVEFSYLKVNCDMVMGMGEGPVTHSDQIVKYGQLC